MEQPNIFGLKSHDCHLLMQKFLPIAMKGSLPNNVSLVIYDLFYFFKELCGKVLSVDNLDVSKHQIAKILCQIEKTFSPFFSL